MTECMLCGAKHAGFVFIIGIGQEFAVCPACVKKYGLEAIKNALTGLFLLAVAKARKSTTLALKAGYIIGKAPEVFAQLAMRNITVNVEFIGPKDQLKVDIDWDTRLDPGVEI